ncbi:LacI family DNA-binding transcriptional regulator [Bifidobacterium canis]|uniref:LacI family transcriptional regulator n=1 Tax=Bifidobacterium canis TaxID=2610880 RepID=A0A7K1J6M4_9BIFI|nr:LacI family DNA-binding transcriptional regulator [Bifidobacterium canis]MUH60262.1 LacI family transcriptional regulator [Bifidobacterium canis]
MQQAGIRDVAREAGVSISTVSRAFTKPELVSQKTRDKVMAAADRLDFNISRSAMALKSGQTYRAALLMSESVTSWFNAEVFAGINDVLHEDGYDISLFQHINDAPTRDKFFSDLPVLRNVDVVFVASFAIEPEEVEQLRRTKVPIIGINVPNPRMLDASISIDDEGGMYKATQHMIHLGHKHIVYTCSAADETLDASIDSRAQGFIRACENASQTRDLDWKVLTVPRGRDFADNALTAVLQEEHFPDAICCQMDMMAIPLMLKLYRHGYSASRDYSIIGFDDSPYADTVGLTTMHQDPYAMGRHAALSAKQLLHGGSLDEPHTVIEPKLVLRLSDSRYEG